MSFPKEWCQFIIKNKALLEGGIVEPIEKVVFKAINARLEKRLRDIKGWKGKYDLVSGDAEETAFAPAAWPEDKDGRYRASYKLGALETDENTYWLSSALGVNNAKLSFRLWVHGALGGRSKGEIDRKILTVGTSVAAREAGMLRDEDGTVYLPFVFDAKTLAAEYPTVDKTLAPLDVALDALLKIHPQIDAAVKDLAAKR